MSKKKGTRCERELFHMLYDKNFFPVRAAGSGSTPIPNPDIIAGKDGRVLAIECKSLKRDNKFFMEKEIIDLKLFSKKFGAEPWLAIKFNNKGWFFINPKYLSKTKSGNFYMNIKLAKEKGIDFKEFIKRKL